MTTDTFYLRFFHFCLLSALVLLCYSNTLHSPWHFDDFGNIVNGSSIEIKELSLSELRKVIDAAWYEPTSNNRPVAAITFALNYLYSGSDTTSYHVVNIILHLITAWLVYLVFQQTIGLYLSRIVQEYSNNIPTSYAGVALLGSILWAIHPIHTQAVTYIVQRQAVMAAMFYMLAMYCYIKSRLSQGVLARIALILLVALFFLLGLGSKQNAVLLPLSLVGYEVAFFRLSLINAFRRSKFFRTISLLIILMLVLVLSVKGKDYVDYLLWAYGYRTFTLWEKLITEPIILLKYIFLLFTPLSDFLVLESDIVASRSLFDPLYTFFAALLISCLGLFGLYLLKRQPIFGYAIFFFFANHIVESTFIPVELYFEHRNYLPSMFIYLAISFSFVEIISFYQKRRKFFLRFAIIVFGTSFLVSEGNATYLRNDVWANDIIMMEDSIAKSPNNIRPYISVASMYMKLRMFDKAKLYLKKAEDIYKKNPSLYQINLPSLIYYNAGILYASEWEKKDIDKAIALLYKSCEFYRGDHLPHMTLGTLLFEKGDYKTAEQAIANAYALVEAAVVYNRMSSIVFKNYGRVLYSNGKIDNAIDVFLKGMQVEPTDEIKLNLIAIYQELGQLNKAKLLLKKMSASNDTPAYLLNVALLNPGDVGNSALEKLASLMVDNDLSYCELIEKVKKNNLFGIIYPDITSIEQKFKDIYMAQLSRAHGELNEKLVKAKSCNITIEKLTDKTSNSRSPS